MADDFSYQVIWSAQALRALHLIGQQAIASGKGREVARLLRSINARLQTRPLKWGQIYRSVGGVDEHEVSHGILAIDFAVDVPRQFVLVRDCERLPGRGATGSEGDD